MLSSHQKQREFLKRKFESGQLSHAYLFAGPKEIGKKTFAKEFAEFIGCKFPDLLIVESINSTSSKKNKKDSLEIDTDQIRDVQKFLSYKSYNGGYKIVIVDNAERMNTDAQDCFLKDLEEPKGKTLIILVSSKPDMMLPTIVSRCQVIKFIKLKGAPANPERVKREEEILKEFLSIIDSNFADKFKYVKSLNFEKYGATDILESVLKYFRNLLMVKIGVEKPDIEKVDKYSVNQLKKIINLIENTNNKLIFTNANQKLALEVLLMEL